MSVKLNKICIFRHDLYQSGGIETWLYNIACLYGKTHDITVYYGTGDKKQMFRLSQKVKCIQYTGQKIKCDVGIWCYDFLGWETTKAKKTVHVIHADYSWNWNFGWGDPHLKNIDEIYAVSEIAARSARKFIHKDVEVLYNPVLPEVKKKTINILSATRLTPEKGFKRIETLIKTLDKRGIDYHWDIYTPSYKVAKSKSPNVTFKKPIMGMLNKIKKADFMVQLSDTESFGYSIVETMAIGTNLIVTDIPVLKELGIDKDNAIVIPLKCKNYNWVVDKILKKAPYVPPYSDYLKIFGPPGVVHYNPFVVKNISSADVLVDEKKDIWLEPGQICTIQDYDGKNKFLKVMK